MAKNITNADIFGGMFGNIIQQEPAGSAKSGSISADTAAVTVRREELHAFRGHPFRVVEDEKMLELAESIHQYGIQEPLLVRPDPDMEGYEIISGHRRNYAAGLAGLEKVPAQIRKMDDDLATIIMVDSNNKREILLPSEKAWSYRMKAEALNHRGKRNDLLPEAEKSAYSAEAIGKNTGESARTIQRYIRLTYLIEDLLGLVDEGKLSIGNGYTISFFNSREQGYIGEYYENYQILPDNAQTTAMADVRERGELDQAAVERIMSKRLKTERRVNAGVTLKNTSLRRYFPANATKEYMEQVIFHLLEQWGKEQGI